MYIIVLADARARGRPDRSPAAVGVLVRQALDQSRTDVPVQPNGSVSDFASLKLSGRRSYKAFTADAQHVGVHCEAGTIKVTPSANDRARRGFGHLPERVRMLTDPDDAALGAAVLDAFADCTCG